MCAAPCGFQVAVHVGPGWEKHTCPSRLSDKAHSSRTRSHTHCKTKCACQTARSEVKASTQFGAIRDRTIQGQNGSYGTMSARGFEGCVDLVLFPQPNLKSMSVPWDPWEGSLLSGPVAFLDSPLKAHMARRSQQEWTEAAGRGESFRAAVTVGGEGSRDKAKHRER